METPMQSPLIRTQIDSPIGAIDLVLEDDTILICEFANRCERTQRQIAKFYQGKTIVVGTAPDNIITAFTAYFAGQWEALNTLKTAPKGTAFQQKVWGDLRTIQAGTTQSYGNVATRLASSARAIGNANGSNPVCLIHPCHRVIGANGSLTGYAGGLERKEWLLRHEGVLMGLSLSA
jgi:methylated-DNA-[protein]-cysteine S-methyltransferase